MSNEDTTVVFTDIHEALRAADREAEEKKACLLAIGGELNGTLFDLPLGVTSIGRNADNTYALEFKGVSRNHLEIRINEDSSKVIDLGSRNGTFLNNEKITTPQVLKKGDVIKIGVIALKYIPKGDPERLTYDKLNREANTDGLTQCYNKMYFLSALDLAVKKCKVTGEPLTLIVFDLDYFKRLNDNFGHDAGDYVLKELSEVIRGHGVREEDVFARYGGEEFVILLPKTNLKQGYEIAERLRRLTADFEFKYEDKILPVTLSVGVADYRQGVNSGVDLFKRADKAVYTSKEGGRNQVNFYRE